MFSEQIANAAEGLGRECSELFTRIVWEIEQESDPVRIEQLAQELNEAMLAEQKEKVRRRLGISAEEMDG